MKATKKLMAALLGATLLMTACGGNGGGSATNSNDTPAGTAGSGEAANSIVLTYSECNSIDSVDGKYAVFFKDKVAELTDGAVVVDIQPSGVLGTESEILDGMISYAGTADIARITCSAFVSYGCKKTGLLGLPYLFESSDHFWNFANSELGAEILAEPEANGLPVQGLFFLEDGFRSFFFKNEVAGIADLKDLKIRVSDDQIMNGLVNGLGASPTVVSFNELWSSLQSGVVDAAEQPIPQYMSNTFYEVAPYVLLDEHTLATSSVIISNDAMNKMTAEQQEAIKEAAKATEEYCKELCADEVEAAKKELEGLGTTFIDVADKAPWRDACSAIISQFTSGLEDTYQGILDLAK